MKAALKHLIPLLVIFVLWLFPENRSEFLYPTTLSLALLALGQFLFALRFKDTMWGGSLPVLAFWSAPIGIFWFLSERKEDRAVSPLTLTVLLVLFAVGTMWVLQKSVLKKHHWPLVFGILLTWGITYFSGSTGSAEPMRASFSLFGLSREVTENLVVLARKLMHISFYGSMAWFFVAHFRMQSTVRGGKWGGRGVLESFLTCLSFACCDEYRQSLMPNREGTVRDVLVDMAAVTAVLWISSRRTIAPEVHLADQPLTPAS